MLGEELGGAACLMASHVFASQSTWIIPCSRFRASTSRIQVRIPALGALVARRCEQRWGARSGLCNPGVTSVRHRATLVRAKSVFPCFSPEITKEQTNIGHPSRGRSFSLETCCADTGHNAGRKAEVYRVGSFGVHTAETSGDLGLGLLSLLVHFCARWVYLYPGANS